MREAAITVQQDEIARQPVDRVEVVALGGKRPLERELVAHAQIADGVDVVGIREMDSAGVVQREEEEVSRRGAAPAQRAEAEHQRVRAAVLLRADVHRPLLRDLRQLFDVGHQHDFNASVLCAAGVVGVVAHGVEFREARRAQVRRV